MLDHVRVFNNRSLFITIGLYYKSSAKPELAKEIEMGSQSIKELHKEQNIREQ